MDNIFGSLVVQLSGNIYPSYTVKMPSSISWLVCYKFNGILLVLSSTFLHNPFSGFWTLVWHHFDLMTITSWRAPWMDRLVFASMLTLFGILICLTYSCMEHKNKYWTGLILLEYNHSSTWCMYIMLSIKVWIYDMETTTNLRV